MTEESFVLQDNERAQLVSGHGDEHLRLLETELGVQIVPRGLELVIKGPEERVTQAGRILQSLQQLSSITPHDVHYAVQMSINGSEAALADMGADVVVTTAAGKQITPKTAGQRRYVQAAADHDIVFCIGPAGTGKTYLAMAAAIAALKRKQVMRIVLTRPAVEAGEHLGFLPGDLQSKVDPYLRPLYDALYEILGFETYQRLKEKGIIEVAPLAYMRGRTLDNSFIILDEAQNTTPEQMKMFLTRMGFGSQTIVTGDITQVDLPRGKTSGLIRIQHVLKNVDGVSFVYLSGKDVVRHPLVQRIIDAYEAYERRGKKKKS